MDTLGPELNEKFTLRARRQNNTKGNSSEKFGFRMYLFLFRYICCVLSFSIPPWISESWFIHLVYTCICRFNPAVLCHSAFSERVECQFPLNQHTNTHKLHVSREYESGLFRFFSLSPRENYIVCFKSCKNLICCSSFVKQHIFSWTPKYFFVCLSDRMESLYKLRHFPFRLFHFWPQLKSKSQTAKMIEPFSDWKFG